LSARGGVSFNVPLSPSPVVRLHLHLVLLLAATLLPILTGCAHLRVGSPEVVRRVQFEGNGNFLEGTSDFQLRKGMVQEKSPTMAFFLPWVKPVPLDRDTLALDAFRIEVWYAHHGYFDARFLGWDVRTRREGRGARAAVVDLVGHVSEGEPTLIGAVDEACGVPEDARQKGVVFFCARGVEGEEPVPGLGCLDPVTRNLFEKNLELRDGDRFDLDAVVEAADFMAGRLRESSFARARVEHRVDVCPEIHRARVRFVISPGPACRFGPVRILGEKTIPEELIRERVAFRPKEAFRPSKIARTRQEIYSLGTFSVVTVTPRQDPTDPLSVPVDIRVTETRFRQLRMGAGVSVESGQQGVHLSSDFKHANIFHRLHRLGLDAEVGFATVATFEELSTEPTGRQIVPTLLTEGTYTWPHFLHKKLELAQKISYEQGLESEYRFLSPSYNPSLLWTVINDPLEDRKLTLSTGWRLKYLDYLDMNVDLTRLQEKRLGLDLKDPFWLSVLEEKFVWDGRDDPLFTRRGTYAAGTVGFAGGPFAGDLGAPLFGQYNYVQLFSDLRRYWSLARLVRSSAGWVFAVRLAGGVELPYGIESRANVPYAERFMVGGGNSVRGWSTDRLGPFLCGLGGNAYVAMQEGQVCEERVPIGGTAAAYGSAEIRIPLRWGLGTVAFLDAGMAWDRPADVLSLPPLPTTGAGIRYASPVGPVRLDVGFRLDDNPYYANESRWNAHFSLSEAF
jgi:outer membrane protein assembly factor BamA